MTLLRLPVDILASITPFLSFTDIDALASTCPIMRRNLYLPGVVTRLTSTVNNPDQAPTRYICNLPSLLHIKLFNLVQEAQFRARKRLPRLLQFGPQLLTLDFFSPESVMTHWEYDFEKPSESSASPLPMVAVPFNFGASFPHLTSLTLSAFNGTVINAAFQDLPTTLTSLQVKLPVPAAQAKPSFPSVKALHRLQTLELRPFDRFNDGEEGCLSHLTSLTCLQIPEFQDELELAQDTIKTLEVGHIGITYANVCRRSCLEMTLKFFGSRRDIVLPEKLTSLTIDKAQSLRFLAPGGLPATLTLLKVIDSDREPTDWNHTFLGLPSGLKHLNMHFWECWREGENSVQCQEFLKSIGKTRSHMLPPALEHLYYRGTPILADIDHLEYLPSTLKTYIRPFSMTSTTDAKIDFAKRLPEVTHLDLSTDLFRMTGETWYLCNRFSLPQRLVSLKLDFLLQDKMNYSKLSPRVDNGSISIRQSILDLNHDALPQTLKFLSVKEDYYPHDLSGLPAGLETLICVFAPRVIEIREEGGVVRERGRISKTLADSLLSLPPGLTKLQLYTRLVIGNVTEFLSALPRSLVDLTLPSLETFRDEHAPLLPRQLQSLYIRHAQELSDDGFLALPPGIERLDLRLNRKLTPNILDRIVSLGVLQDLCISCNRNFPRALWKPISARRELNTLHRFVSRKLRL